MNSSEIQNNKFYLNSSVTRFCYWYSPCADENYKLWIKHKRQVSEGTGEALKADRNWRVDAIWKNEMALVISHFYSFYPEGKLLSVPCQAGKIQIENLKS